MLEELFSVVSFSINTLLTKTPPELLEQSNWSDVSFSATMEVMILRAAEAHFHFFLKISIF